MIAGHSYSAAALHVLALVRDGKPFDGVDSIQKPARAAHLSFLRRKGTVRYANNGYAWELTDAGREILEFERQRSDASAEPKP